MFQNLDMTSNIHHPCYVCLYQGILLFLQSLSLRMQMISRLAKNSGCSALLERYYKTNKSVLLVVIDQ